MKKITLNLIATIFSLALLSACATGSAIVTGTKRTPVPPEMVKLYLNPPAKYEVIGLVESKSDVEFSRQNAQNRTIENMKKRAGRLGANGILLTSSGSGGNAWTGHHIKGQAQAIFVIEE